MNIRWLNFPFQLNINIDTTLGHQHWIDVILSTLFQRCLVNVEAKSINIRQLNFHFSPNLNVETILVHRGSMDVILSTFFQRCFANVETTSINVRRLNFHFQQNINVETTLMNVEDQHCFKVDSMLMCLLGSSLSFDSYALPTCLDILSFNQLTDELGRNWSLLVYFSPHQRNTVCEYKIHGKPIMKYLSRTCFWQ